jgi:hypothetical protein
MLEDPIIEEIHRVREEIAAEFNYDLDAIVAHLRQQQQAENRQVVSLPPKRVATDADISEVQERVSELIHREKTTGLSAEETAELDDYLNLEHLGRLAKARLHQRPAGSNESTA